jgi:hypothetical protein
MPDETEQPIESPARTKRARKTAAAHADAVAAAAAESAPEPAPAPAADMAAADMAAPEPDAAPEPAAAPRWGSFFNKAREVAGQAASTAAKVSVDVAGKTAHMASEAGEKAVTTMRDPATKARARGVLKKARLGLTTALERIDPKILADVVIKATSLQERANASLKERGSIYRIGEISIGASIPPSINFVILRIDDPDLVLEESATLLAKAAEEGGANGAGAKIVTLDGTAVEEHELDELVDEVEA